MGLNEQVQYTANQLQNNRKFVFKQGVKFKNMGGKDAVLFRMLPAYNPQDPNPMTSVVPFITPEGHLTDWGAMLYISRFVGHGRGDMGSRTDIISLKTADVNAACPLETLLKTINAAQGDWGYLTQDAPVTPGTDENTRERKAIAKPAPHLIANILDLQNILNGVQVGVFSSSSVTSLMGPKTGLIYQRNNIPQEIIATNYLLSYAVGDLTHPVEGPVLVLSQDTTRKNAKFQSFVITQAQDNMGRTLKRAIEPELLKARYDMRNIASFVNIPTEEEIIQALINVLNGRSPKGYHEYALLRMAFPTFPVPAEPSAPASHPMVGGGGFGVNPSSSPAAAQYPYGPGQAAPVAPGSFGPGQAAPVAPGSFGPGQAAPATTIQSVQGNLQAAVASGATAAPGIVPGDAVPGTGAQFDAASFISKLKASGGIINK